MARMLRAENELDGDYCQDRPCLSISRTHLNDVVWFKQNLAQLLLIIDVNNQFQYMAGLALSLQFKAKSLFYLE